MARSVVDGRRPAYLDTYDALVALGGAATTVAIIERSGYSDHTVRKALRSLVASGHVIETGPHREGRISFYRYRIRPRVRAPQPPAPVASHQPARPRRPHRRAPKVTLPPSSPAWRMPLRGPHPFTPVGSYTQCTACWGWIDDPRHTERLSMQSAVPPMRRQGTRLPIAKESRNA